MIRVIKTTVQIDIERKTFVLVGKNKQIKKYFFREPRKKFNIDKIIFATDLRKPTFALDYYDN